MKEILVPVDFSMGSIHALKYAIRLANELDARIHIIHVYESGISAEHIPPAISKVLNEGEEYEAREAFHDFGLDILSQMEVEVPLQSKLGEGNVVKEIVDYSEEINADLIVLGTWRARGASGIIDTWFGTIGTKLINKSARAVLFIPRMVQFTKIEHLAYATNFREKQQRIPTELTALARKLKLNISCLNVRTPEKKYNRIQFELLERMKKLEGDELNIHFYSLSGEYIIDTLNNFVINEKVNMLGVLKHEKLTVFERILAPDIPQVMAFNSKIPLLILQEKFLS